MKRFLVLSMFFIFNFVLAYVIGCTPKGIPVVTTIPPTQTPTATAIPMGPTPTPGTATFPVLYNDGALASVVTTTGPFDGNNNNAANFPTLNAIDTTIGNGYGGDWYGYLTEYTAGELSGFSGWTVYGPYTGFSLTGASMDFSAYTTCKFWAKANESASVGFNAAEPSNDTNNIAENLTTTWTQYTITINGTRTDGYSSGGITSAAPYFVEVLTTLPSIEPLFVSVDKITFQ